MAARHGTISPTLRAGVPFLGGLRGGGGLAVVVCTLPCGGGSPVGAPSGLAENTRWRPLGPWAPSRKNLGFAGGDSASVASVVWPQWNGLSGMASVVWPQWYGLSGIAAVVWPQWYGRQLYGLSGMASVQWRY